MTPMSRTRRPNEGSKSGVKEGSRKILSMSMKSSLRTGSQGPNVEIKNTQEKTTIIIINIIIKIIIRIKKADNSNSRRRRQQLLTLMERT